MVGTLACIVLMMAAFAAVGFVVGVVLGAISHCDEEDRS